MYKSCSWHHYIEKAPYSDYTQNVIAPVDSTALRLLSRNLKRKSDRGLGIKSFGTFILMSAFNYLTSSIVCVQSLAPSLTLFVICRIQVAIQSRQFRSLHLTLWRVPKQEIIYSILYLMRVNRAYKLTRKESASTSSKRRLGSKTRDWYFIQDGYTYIGHRICRFHIHMYG